MDAWRVIVEKPTVILSGVPGGFATGTQRRIADSNRAEAVGGYTRSLVPAASARFTVSDSSLCAAPPAPTRRSVQNDGVVLD